MGSGRDDRLKMLKDLVIEGTSVATFLSAPFIGGAAVQANDQVQILASETKLNKPLNDDRPERKYNVVLDTVSYVVTGSGEDEIDDIVIRHKDRRVERRNVVWRGGSDPTPDLPGVVRADALVKLLTANWTGKPMVRVWLRNSEAPLPFRPSGLTDRVSAGFVS